MHATDDECPGELDEVKTSSPVVKRPSVTPLLETPDTSTPETPTSTNPLTKDEAKSDPEFDALVDVELEKRREPANVETGEPVSPRARPGGDRQTEGHDLAARLLSPWSCFRYVSRCGRPCPTSGRFDRVAGRADGVYIVADRAGASSTGGAPARKVDGSASRTA